LSAGSVETNSITANAVTSAKIASNSILSRHIANNSIVGADISATTQITASTFTGALTGDVTGNVVGNLTGTIQTAAQTNITSVGTLTGFTSTGIDDNATSTAITIDSSENVGIGASSVQSWAKLQVAGTAGAQTGAKQALYIQSPTATANEGVGIRMSAASGSHEAVGIIGMVNNASGNAGSMTFHTYNLGATIPEVMRITNTGNVGIGTSSPVGKTHIKNNNTYATSSQTSYDNASLRLDNLNTSSSIGTSFGIISPNVNYLQSGYNEGTTAPFALNPYGGNVGIGTSSPATTLDVVAGSTGGIRLKPTGQITNGYTGGLADFRQGLTFENAASSHAFSIGYGQGGHLRVSFHDGSSTFTELVEFKNSGTLNLSAGNLEIQPGYGIDFSGNANASGMSSELLDDYEEGTFTATIGSNGTHPTITQGNTIDCRYTKIGNVCTVHGYSGVRNITAVGTGSPLISGLPFTATNYAQPVLGHCNMFPDSVSGYVEVNQSYFFPIKVGATAHDAYTTGAKYIMFSMTYRVN